MRAISVLEIKVSPNRQRSAMDAQGLMDLADSISKNGLLHPVVVRKNGISNYTLVAGERRLKAIDILWNMGNELRCEDKSFIEGFVPVTYLGDMDPVDAFEAELDENLHREDLSWQDRATATAQLYELRRMQAEKAGQPEPPPSSLGTELYPDYHPDAASKAVRRELILARNLHDPDVAKAANAEEGMKVLKRKEESQRSIELGKAVGSTFGAHSHQLYLGDCLHWMRDTQPDQFDVILTDPPYGIDAQNFNDSGGKANAAGHTYDDSLNTWLELMRGFSNLSYRVAKSQAHLYCFCDIDNFLSLRNLMGAAGWNCFRTPFIWHNPSGQRAPWPQTGPHRKWQMLLYAIKGGRPVLNLKPDLVTYASDENLGWAAQKPVDLYRDLLSRSCRAGDSALDPFAGSGPIFPAAHSLKIRATGVETNPTAYGIAVKRIGELK